MISVAVVIPAYNCRGDIAELLESLQKQTVKPERIIIGDDRSTDGTDKVAGEYPGVEVYRTACNMGPGAARNIALKHVAEDLILFTDSDCLVPEDWVAKHIQAHRELPAAAIIAGSVRGEAHGYWGKVDSLVTWFNVIPSNRIAKQDHVHVQPANMSITAGALATLKGFRDDLRCCEDAEFCHRAWTQGLPVYFYGPCEVRHKDRTDFRSIWRRNRAWGRYAVPFRHGVEGARYSMLFPSTLFGALIKALPLAGAFSAFIVTHWIRTRPSVLLYWPGIFFMKCAYNIGIIDYLRRK